jgi:hypothetical protein
MGAILWTNSRSETSIQRGSALARCTGLVRSRARAPSPRSRVSSLERHVPLSPGDITRANHNPTPSYPARLQRGCCRRPYEATAATSNDQPEPDWSFDRMAKLLIPAVAVGSHVLRPPLFKPCVAGGCGPHAARGLKKQPRAAFAAFLPSLRLRMKRRHFVGGRLVPVGSIFWHQALTCQTRHQSQRCRTLQRPSLSLSRRGTSSRSRACIVGPPKSAATGGRRAKLALRVAATAPTSARSA